MPEVGPKRTVFQSGFTVCSKTSGNGAAAHLGGACTRRSSVKAGGFEMGRESAGGIRGKHLGAPTQTLGKAGFLLWGGRCGPLEKPESGLGTGYSRR